MKNTVLYNSHIKLNALMAEFAGWNMPIHYGSIIEEAKHTRSKTSVFDITHMGEFLVEENMSSPSLDKLITNPVSKMKEKTCRYGFLLNEAGGVLDDLIVYRLSAGEWMVVVNAGTIEKDEQAIKTNLSKNAKFKNISENIVKLDVQGPTSFEVMKSIVGEPLRKLKYFQFDEFEFLGGKYIVSRTGYTGELGYEIYIDASKGLELWEMLLKHPDVKPAGLGARDILRLEAGLPLYSDELTEDTSPVEAGMEKFIDFEKDFVGKGALLKQINNVSRKLVGLSVEGRRTPRHTNKILVNNIEKGIVTSGVFSPHLNKGIAFGYIATEQAKEGTKVIIDTGKGTIEATITIPPFIKETSIRKQL
ncbi:MAG: glycine cleavage system aminomethyltransferase GcvT [bacterium]